MSDNLEIETTMLCVRKNSAKRAAQKLISFMQDQGAEGDFSILSCKKSLRSRKDGCKYLIKWVVTFCPTVETYQGMAAWYRLKATECLKSFGIELTNEISGKSINLSDDLQEFIDSCLENAKRYAEMAKNINKV